MFPCFGKYIMFNIPHQSRDKNKALHGVLLKDEEILWSNRQRLLSNVNLKKLLMYIPALFLVFILISIKHNYKLPDSDLIRSPVLFINSFWNDISSSQLIEKILSDSFRSVMYVVIGILFLNEIIRINQGITNLRILKITTLFNYKVISSSDYINSLSKISLINIDDSRVGSIIFYTKEKIFGYSIFTRYSNVEGFHLIEDANNIYQSLLAMREASLGNMPISKE